MSENEVRHRVWRVDAALREAVTAKRDRQGKTSREFLRQAVQAELPALMQALAELGVGVEDAEGATPVRWAVDEDTLQALRHASQWTGLDQCQLLVACLRLATRRKRPRRT